jgi:hypothetical protein
LPTRIWDVPALPGSFWTLVSDPRRLLLVSERGWVLWSASARTDSLDRHICMGDYTQNAARFAPVSSLHSEPNRNREGDKHAAPPSEIIPLMLLVRTNQSAVP